MTLRITITEKPETVIVKLEGGLAGPFVAELGRAWRELAPSLAAKRLAVDLSDAIYVDADGVQLLGAMRRQSGAELVARTPLSKYYAEEVMGRNSNGQGGN